MNNILSRSGARRRGDEYQDIVTLLYVLPAIMPDNGVVRVGIEDSSAGNADDVTVYRVDGRHEFVQVKSMVDGSRKINLDWLMALSDSGRKSIIQGLYAVWSKYSSESIPITLTLFSNGLVDSSDPFFTLRDGKHGTVSDRLERVTDRSELGKCRRKLAEHLGVTNEELIRFLAKLKFQLGLMQGDLRNLARYMMLASGLRPDEHAIIQAEKIVSAWVTDGVRSLTPSEIMEYFAPLKAKTGFSSSSLLVQAIDRDIIPVSATVTLDWVELFESAEARTRRRLKDESQWNRVLRPEILQAANTLRSRGASRVLVRGFMRLPSWFTCGSALGRTAGFSAVACFQGDALWVSEGDLVDYRVKIVRNDKLSNGNELAISLAVSMDPSEDVIEYLRKTPHHVSRYISIAPELGVSNRAFQSDAQVRQWAYHARDEIRGIVRNLKPSKLHLFLAVPQGAALILGHLWDRMPETQLYEDGGSTGTYIPSFLIPN